MSSHDARRASANAIKETQQTFFESLYASRDADAHAITPDIHLGAASASADRKAMQKRGISHVLICHPALKEQHPQHFKYGRAPLMDMPTANLLELLPDALGFLMEARSGGGRVFVYCAKGISRSSSTVIALLMFEKHLSFQEAFGMCEKKRPIVYPNVGFQQQLKHFEGILQSGAVDKAASWETRIKQLRKAVPKGELQAVLPINDLIGEIMEKVLAEVEVLAQKVLAQPQLLQQRELWKRHGLFFENMHKYKALPGSAELLDKAQAASTTLKSLPKIFSDTLKGVKLALGVAKEMDSWAAFAKPILTNPLLAPKAPDKPAEKAAEQDAREGSIERDDEEDPMAGLLDGKAAASAKESESGKEKKDMEKEKDKEKDKKSKKDKKKEKEKEKKLKKEMKDEKKAEKAAKKAESAIAKIEKAALKAELLAESSRNEAEQAAERAQAIEKEVQELEAEENFEKRNSAAAQRAGKLGREKQSSSDRSASPAASQASSRSSGSPSPKRRR